jgi:hypothetical protein
MWIRADSSARGGESRIGTLNRTAEDFKRFSPARMLLRKTIGYLLRAWRWTRFFHWRFRACSALDAANSAALLDALEALKRLNGGTIHLPDRMKDRPDRDRLAIRFERFKAVA